MRTLHRWLLFAVLLFPLNLVAQDTLRVEATAQESGYFYVIVDGTETSRHSAEREALQQAVNALLGGADAVRYEHRYSVLVTLLGGGGPTLPPDTVVPAPAPQAVIEMRASGLTVALDGGNSTGAVESYAWDLGKEPGRYATGPVVSATYPHPGERTVVLTVTDTEGRTSETSSTFTVGDVVQPPPDTTTTPPDTTTPPPLPAGVLFEDDFESGGYAPSQNGVSWGSSNGSNGGVSLKVDETSASGRHSLLFRYGASPSGGDSFAEKRFRLPNIREGWIEYMLWVPANYAHRVDGGPTNNKWFGLWRGAYNALNMHRVQETRTSNSPGGISSNRSWGPNNSHGVPVWSGKDLWIGPGAPIKPGQWSRLGYYWRSSSGPGVADGVMQNWVNGQLEIEAKGVVWPQDGSAPYFDNGYILGWANSGYTEETRFYVDDFRVGAGNPGW